MSSRCRRKAAMGFKRCGQRSDCSVCAHSSNSTSHTCNSTGESFPIESIISCVTPWVIYSITCDKGSGQCAQVKGPHYVGCSERPFKKRFSEHVGPETQPCHSDTDVWVFLFHLSPQNYMHNIKNYNGTMGGNSCIRVGLVGLSLLQWSTNFSCLWRGLSTFL